MIPEKMSKEELIDVVRFNCTVCIKDYPPFKKDELYVVYQDEYAVTVLSDDKRGIDFTYVEAREYFSRA
jgi:hypothetical protein